MQEPWALTAHDVLEGLDAGATGLTEAEASSRLRTAGPNRLPVPPNRPWWRRVLPHLDDVLIVVLLLAAVVKAVMREWVDAAVILAVAVINTAIGVIQEGRAERALDAIKGMLSVRAHALRDGAWTTVDAETLVPGDVVRLRPGDRVPADARLLEATNLQVEESALTGESVAAVKDLAPVDASANVGDRTNMVFSGTLVVAGAGSAVVVATGADTEIGRIQTMISEAESLETPLARTLNDFGRRLVVLILVLAGVMTLVGWLAHGMTGSTLASAAIGFAVAAIPEGLPALVTITLALGVQQMARRRAITRRMAAVETLGSVSTICSDKTGTLTQNEMTVRIARTREREYAVEGVGYAPVGQVTLDGRVVGSADAPDLLALAEAMALCNDAHLLESGGGWRLVGEPTEGAVLVLGRKAGVDGQGWQRLAEIPFESETKYMATLVQDPEGARHVLVKGALDSVAARCATQRGPEGLEAYDADFWDAQIAALGGQGLRVLAAARATADPTATSLDGDGPRNLTLVGVVGIVDPPRPEAIDAIAEARRAGIAVTMITGDHVGTAVAIAREMGIVHDENAPALTGADLEAMDDARLRDTVRDVHVYARTSPEHKLRIVRALQAHREVVAMTGDGVNDAPALTQADVGVAMGIKGTEATKEAADVVLADDNFATIERAVAEGRRIYDNIRKAVLFLLPTNGAQSLVIFGAVLLGLTLPLEPTQVLWINMVTSVTLSLPLANEPREPGVMERPPRDPDTPLLTAAFLRRIMLVSVLIGGATWAVFAYEQSQGAALPRAQATAVTMLALGQLAYLFSCRFLDRSSLTRDVLRGNGTLWWSTLALIALQVMFLYVPALQDVFGVAAIGLREWIMTALLAVVIFLVVEAIKWLGRRPDRPAGPVRRA
jgi:calcium-translocating P-type ATPase